MDVFLLRHAETQTNEQGVLSSSIDGSLTQIGLEQASSIVAELENLGINAIVSSPYLRALKTVEPFSKASGLKVQDYSCLAEGQLVLDSTLKSEEPKYGPSNGYPIQGETKEQFLGRAKQASELLLKQKDSRILVVSHGHMIRELINIFIQSSNKVRFPHDNCGLTHISFGDHVTIRYLNRAIGSDKSSKRDAVNDAPS